MRSKKKVIILLVAIVVVVTVILGSIFSDKKSNYGDSVDKVKGYDTVIPDNEVTGENPAPDSAEATSEPESESEQYVPTKDDLNDASDSDVPISDKPLDIPDDSGEQEMNPDGTSPYGSDYKEFGEY